MEIRIEGERSLFLHPEREAQSDKLLKTSYKQASEIVINLYNSLLKGI